MNLKGALPQYTTIDPVTERVFEGFSKRLKFRRKFERSHLPLLIIRYEGLIGAFAKEDLVSEVQQLQIRSNLSKMLSKLHPAF